jgi:LytR cell envelope-related transcriptional attenuator
VGGDAEGGGHRGANLTVRVDHPLAPPVDDLNPWRVTALVAGTIAAVELVVLVIGGAVLLGRTVGHHERTPAAHHGSRAAAAHPPRPAKVPAQPPAGRPRLTRAQTTVLVLNGNGVAGAAGAAAGRVRARGYRIAAVGNAARRTDGRSIVMYRPGYRAEALRLGRDLQVRLVAPLDGLRASGMHGARLALVVGTP